MLHKRAHLFVTLIAWAACGGCWHGRIIAVQDSAGATVVLKGPARRIVSTVPSNTEILYAIGAEAQVVGVTQYCGKTCKTEGKAVIGGWVDADLETVRALNPDLIFAFGGAQSPLTGRLRRIAPTYLFEPTTVQETLGGVLTAGHLTGHADEAKAIFEREQATLRRVQEALAAVPKDKRVKAARVFGPGEKVTTAGKKSVIGDVIAQAGGVNVFGDVDEDYFEVEFTRLAKLDPDVLIVHGEPADVEKRREEFAKCPFYSQLRAVKNGRVVVISCDHICHPNATIAETVEMVARGSYPDRFAAEK